MVCPSSPETGCSVSLMYVGALPVTEEEERRVSRRGRDGGGRGYFA